MGQPPVLTSPNPLSTLQKQFAYARLSRPCLPGSSSRLFCNVHHHRFSRQQLAVAWDQRPDHRTRRAFLHLSYSCAQPCGPATLVTHDPGTDMDRCCSPRTERFWNLGRNIWPYSAFAPETLTTLAHFSVSSAMNLAKSAGEPE